MMVTVWKVELADSIMWTNYKRDAAKFKRKFPEAELSKYVLEDDVWDAFMEKFDTRAEVH